MIANPKIPYMTPQEYLIWEEKQQIKHEYIDGEVYAMTGGTIPHNEIAVNLTTILKNYLRGKGCKVLMADAKLGITENGPFYYPDVMVTCDPRDKKAKKIIHHPCLIIEVLSPTTEAFDRGDKFRDYRRLNTLQEYLLVNTKQISVECFRLNQQSFWELHPYQEGDEINLTTLNFSFPLHRIYEDVELF